MKLLLNLSNRYITDRHLPDKAIDVFDEAGSRVHMGNFEVPEEILDLEEEIEKVKKEKAALLKNRIMKKLLACEIKKRNLQSILKLQNVNGKPKQKISFTM